MPNLVNIWGIIGVIGLLDFALRFLPLALLTRLTLPKFLDTWLRHAATAILSALLFQRLFWVNGSLSSGWNDFTLLGALASLVIVLTTRSLLYTALGGIVVVVLAQNLAKLFGGG